MITCSRLDARPLLNMADIKIYTLLAIFCSNLIGTTIAEQFYPDEGPDMSPDMVRLMSSQIQDLTPYTDSLWLRFLINRLERFHSSRDGDEELARYKRDVGMMPYEFDWQPKRTDRMCLFKVCPMQMKNMARGKRPDMKRPDMKRPDMKRPDMKRPDMKRPDMKRPDMKRPDMKRPDMKRPDMKRPDMKRPDMKRPDMKRPDMKRPDMKRPDMKRPDMKRRGYFGDVDSFMFF